MENDTVSINGTVYDSHTGDPVDDSTNTRVASQSRASEHHAITAHAIHHRSQKSKTLRRQSLNVPSNKIHVRSVGEPQHQTRSAAITRFAPHPVIPAADEEPADIPAQSHPLTEKVKTRSTQQSPAVASTKDIKDQAIQSALASAKDSDEHPKKRRSRTFSMATGGLALLLLAGYLTYISMPTISTRIAAVQSGINASYPTYQPSGYSLAGPIEYGDGAVKIAFVANGGPHNYTINEVSTSWNSSALLENYVEPIAGGNYSTHQQGGLTIYTYDEGAAWVNGGILYTIEGNAPLSEDQILKIAGSL